MMLRVRPAQFDHHQRVGIRREVVHAPGELRAGRVDAPGNAHALVFLQGTRVEDDQLRFPLEQLLELIGGNARCLIFMLDELAEGLRGHVDAAEELSARRLPAGAAAVQDRDIGIAPGCQALCSHG